MKHVSRTLILLVLNFFAISRAEGQFTSLLQKAKDKAAQKASDMMDKKSSTTKATASGSTSANQQSSATEYLTSAGEYVSLLYYNDHEVNVANTRGKNLSTDFDLTSYTNRVMRISMNVDGDRMAAYLDKTKIADTQLFLPADTRNFYISAPMQYQNGAKLLFGNLRVSTFKKGTGRIVN